MDLNNTDAFSSLDSHNLLSRIDAFPQALQSGWEQGCLQPLPNLSAVRQVVLAASQSAAAAEITAACVASASPLPVFVLKSGDSPPWLAREDTLLLSAGGESLQEGRGLSDGIVPSPYPIETAADPLQFARTVGSLLAVFFRLGLAPQLEEDFIAALQALKTQQARIRAGVEVCQNPAKRLAGQFMERWVVLVGAEFLTPAARCWKTRINICARAFASAEDLPGPADYPGLGTEQPEGGLSHLMAVFFQSPLYPDLGRSRMDALRMKTMMDGVNTDVFSPPGESRLAQCLSALHFGDYCAYYLAMLYGVDPTPTADL